ncbi:M20/M25/M40 family metallo-hydrolase [Pectobacterium parvum]|uniref:M20/M25/M40 family metallo-hydrolase n=1 Tax=Pectobacterium parvum TaxID=2778550 RepID=UPI0005048915|nr:M20/M25/M40 family metallo-hydrolase [Pectobacterium parvum]KFX10616.1 hypothetical protein KP17_18185 [Pectobacterium parvum]MCU1800687.1 M20/M25/M40 family metallo-hydrolase [Pectobacterium parvum]UFK38886.1 M20/M25/M40 family metallo-hydrolase [Pectobacterium parvum]
MKNNNVKYIPDLSFSLNLATSLIECYPAFGLPGQKKAQEIVCNTLQEIGCDQLFWDEFCADDLSHLKDYVDVSCFGDIFENYQNLTRYNVVAVFDSFSPGPTLILNGHIDVDYVYDEALWTVTDGWRKPFILNNRLYGRGSTDMLMGLVSNILIGKWLAENRTKWTGKVVIVSVIDEEVGGNGTLRSLEFLKCRNLLSAKTECLISEPSDGRMCIESLGFVHCILQAKALPIHMGVATPENNAFWKLCKALKCLEEKYSTSGFRFNLGIIGGGKEAAIPLGSCKAECTIFYPFSFLLDNLKTEIELICSTMDVSCYFSSFNFEGASYEISSLAKNILNKSNTDSSAFSSDSSLFPSPCDARLYKEYNIPTVIFGPGYLKDAHSIDESICLKQWQEIHCLTLSGCVRYLNDY